jgi:DNA-binding transcriptional ArsR family regulator
MVKYGIRTQKLDAVFSALADPTRRKILRQLADRSLTVSELAAPHRMSLPAVSKHLSVLERARLLTRRRQGRHLIVQLQPEPLKEAAAHVEFYRRFWNEKLDALQQYAERG